MRRLALLALLALSACSARSDFDNMCNAEQRSGIVGAVTPADKATQLAQWIQDHIHTSDAKKTFAALGSVTDPKMKGQLLKQAAHEAGYDGPCPMADEMINAPAPTPPR